MKDKFQTSGSLHIISLILFLISVPVLSQTASFGGSWRSTLGQLDVAVTGSSIEASYVGSGSGGSIEGKVFQKGRLMVGNWVIPKRYGRLLLRLSPGGGSFSGEWHDDKMNLGGKWIGVRLDPEFKSEPLTAADVNGVWDSNYGRMNFSGTAEALSATFRGVSNRGSMTAKIDLRTNQVLGNWKDEKSEGKIIMKILKNGDGFVADWWYENGIYGGIWYGVRPAQLTDCIAGNCDDGWGSYVWSDGNRFDGDWQQKSYHGIGATYSPQGHQKSRGLWISGVYQGRWLSGNYRDGQGKLRQLDGTVYEGHFKDGLPHDLGSFTFPNGDTYEGEFKDGFPYGNGTYIWQASGDKYVGNIARGKIQGTGSYYFSTGEVYNGGFRRGKPHGKGNFTWLNQDSYEGGWRNGELSGDGIYSFQNGDVYEGRFRKGVKEGKGVYTSSDGITFSGNWKNGEVESFEITAGNSADNPPFTHKTQPVPAVEPATYQESTAAFIAYKDVQLRTISLEEGEKDGEINFHYYLLYGPRDLAESAAQSYLEDRAKFKVSDGYAFEKANNANTRIGQLVSRYRLGEVKPRINMLLEKSFVFEGRSD